VICGCVGWYGECGIGMVVCVIRRIWVMMEGEYSGLSIQLCVSFSISDVFEHTQSFM
jgi:hypothetical protein